jgi:hypothetical protein
LGAGRELRHHRDVSGGAFALVDFAADLEEVGERADGGDRSG